MANNHHIVVNSGILPFATFPIKLTSTTPFVFNYSYTSTGRTIGTTGTRIWDSNVLPPSGVITITPQTPLTFPFTTINLPTAYFDSISLLIINGDRYIQAFSNSPDNVAAFSSTNIFENKIVYSLQLYSAGINDLVGSNNANNNYMFGGTTIGTTARRSIDITFASQTLTSIIMTMTYKFHDYVGTNYATDSINYTIPQNTLKYVTPLFTPYDFYGLSTYSPAGYYTITLTTTDPNYVSALPFYHWGQS